MKVGNLLVAGAIIWASSLSLVVTAKDKDEKGGKPDKALDASLAQVLRDHEFTGRIESTLEQRLGRKLDVKLAELGRMLWFDNVHSLHRDNTCGGCHSPANGFGDTQSIAICVDSNRVVGPNRTGPRNQRRTPMVINSAFFPKLMWNGRFSANPAVNGDLGDPFDNSQGFNFPSPEGNAQEFTALNHPQIKHLLQAQAFIPPTELVEVAGFTGTAGTISPDFDQFDNGVGLNVPLADPSTGSRNYPIRAAGLEILNSTPAYRLAFGKVFPEVKAGAPITFDMFGLAIAEFEFTLTFADAPIDQFARGQKNAMTDAEKRGALVFFGSGNCVTCHAVKGKSNEMFSDFQNRVVGIPQIAPFFGVGLSNMIYDGPGRDEDFGLEQLSFPGEAPNDRYKFRTSPLRNVALQPAFFHNGSYTTLESAIRFHLNTLALAPLYNAAAQGVDADLTHRLGPIQPVLDKMDPEMTAPALTEAEKLDLIAFVKTGLLDPRAKKENLCKLIPKVVPSGLPVLTFEGCPSKKDKD